jgi:hypothetical protein
MITITHSVNRAKIPVIPLGETTITGFALGTKTVAGTGVRVVLTDDELYRHMNVFIAEKATAVENAVKNFDLGLRGVQSIPYKNYNDFMQDDLSEFNIHLITLPEHDVAQIRIQSILGATIINTGKIFSIDNLITEETFSYMARTVKTEGNLDVPSRTIISSNTNLTGTNLLNKYKR